jgi:hypothetical protein
MRRLAASLVLAAFALAVLAPVALASDSGQGLWGETNDKVVTNAGFIVIAFFPLLILVLSVLQARLDRRKASRLAAKKARAGADWRGGW